MNIKNYAAQCPNHFKGRYGYKPDMIVLHNTGGLKISSAYYWFLDATSKTSAHFVVGLDGEIQQYVNLSDGSYCNGTTLDASLSYYYKNATNPLVQSRAYNANWYTVAIEFVGNVGDKLNATQLKAAVSLIKYIRQQVQQIYGTNIPLDRNHIVGHYTINPITRATCGVNIQYDAILTAIQSESKAVVIPDSAPVSQTPTTATNPLTSDISIPTIRKAPAGVKKINPYGFKHKN